MDSPIKSNIPRVEITIQKISNEEKKKKNAITIACVL